MHKMHRRSGQEALLVIQWSYPASHSRTAVSKPSSIEGNIEGKAVQSFEFLLGICPKVPSHIVKHSSFDFLATFLDGEGERSYGIPARLHSTFRAGCRSTQYCTIAGSRSVAGSVLKALHDSTLRSHWPPAFGYNGTCKSRERSEGKSIYPRH